MWKVYRISTGDRLKAGFENEDSARDWMQQRISLDESDHDIEEMDEEEEEEYLESMSDDEDSMLEDSYEPEPGDAGYVEPVDTTTELASDGDTDYLSDIQEQEERDAAEDD